MRSLQARMLATLGAIVVLSWAASIWIIVALMFHGKDSALEHELTHFGAQLLAALPDPIERQIATVDAAHLRARRNARAHDQAAADAESPAPNWNARSPRSCSIPASWRSWAC